MPEPPQLAPLTDAPLSLILLAHDEAPHLTEVVDAWKAALTSLGRPHEMILVDDGSGDGTPFLAGGLPGVRLLGHAVRRGPGAALRTGLAAARHPAVVCVTCDRQFRPDDLAKLLKELDQAHLVSGYRVSRPVPLPLRVLGWIYRILFRIILAMPHEPLPGWLGWKDYALWLGCRLIFGLRIHDVRCPFRAFRREILPRIPIQSDSWFAHVEVLAKANFVAWMADVPVPHTPRPEPARTGRVGSTWKDFRKVFDKPDFGPAVIPPTVDGGGDGSSSRGTP